MPRGDAGGDAVTSPIDPAVHEQLARDYEAAERRAAELFGLLTESNAFLRAAEYERDDISASMTAWAKAAGELDQKRLAAIAEADQLRAKLAEAERERDAARSSLEGAIAQRDDERRSALEERASLRAEVERLRAELAEARRQLSFVSGRQQQPSEAPKVGDRVRVVRCCAPGSGHEACSSFVGREGMFVGEYEEIQGETFYVRLEEGAEFFAAVERVEQTAEPCRACDGVGQRPGDGGAMAACYDCVPLQAAEPVDWKLELADIIEDASDNYGGPAAALARRLTDGLRKAAKGEGK